MSEKIQPSHIEREACVYIRQSTMQQVRTRLEGQRRQYDLRERAQALGFQRVVVIDEDLGRSGTGSVERPGFEQLEVEVRRVLEDSVVSGLAGDHREHGDRHRSDEMGRE